MEERLFWIGIVMGAYAWATKRWAGDGRLDDRLKAALWHALFLAMAAFAAVLVAVLSIESRSRNFSAGGPLGLRELAPSLLGALAAGLWGFWRSYGEGRDAEKRRFLLNEDLEWAETVFSAVLLASLLMYFVVQAFKIPSGSMESTLKIGDHLFVNKFIYGVRIPFTEKRVLRLKDIQRRDIVVFRFPTDDPKEEHCGSSQYGKDFIKRVIGLPGDTVELRGGRVFINGQADAHEPFAQYLDAARMERFPGPFAGGEYQSLWQERRLDKRLGDAMRDEFGPITVPDGAYFVMGDNRDRSCDGRYWGPVWKKYLKGKAWVIYWPPSRMGRIS
jgi:signal peptidase I